MKFSTKIATLPVLLPRIAMRPSSVILDVSTEFFVVVVGVAIVIIIGVGFDLLALFVLFITSCGNKEKCVPRKTQQHSKFLFKTLMLLLPL